MVLMVWSDPCNYCGYGLDRVTKAYLDGDTIAVMTVGDTRLGSCCQLTLCNAVVLWRVRTHTRSPMQGGFLGPIPVETKEIF